MQKQWGSYGEKNLANELAGEKNEAFPPAFDNRINPGSESGTEDPIPELLCSFPPQEQNQSFQVSLFVIIEKVFSFIPLNGLWSHNTFL